jgi:hypothetical protein
MKKRAACLFACVVMSSACQKEKEITVTETREPTTRDASPKLFATNDERFRDAKPSPVVAETPPTWLALPATQLRLLNYRFGESGTGEVSVSLSTGSVLDNVNRWLHNQFGGEAIDAAGLAKLPPVTLAGNTGVWVITEGAYKNMQAEPIAGFALAGVIVPVGGKIVTVKMVGPKAEVEAAKPALQTYIKSVRLAE